jgi:hypothetical protein
MIRVNVKLAEAPSHGKTIFEYDASSNGAKDYASLAGELLGEVELPPDDEEDGRSVNPTPADAAETPIETAETESVETVGAPVDAVEALAAAAEAVVEAVEATLEPDAEPVPDHADTDAHAAATASDGDDSSG